MLAGASSRISVLMRSGKAIATLIGYYSRLERVSLLFRYMSSTISVNRHATVETVEKIVSVVGACLAKSFVPVRPLQIRAHLKSFACQWFEKSGVSPPQQPP